MLVWSIHQLTEFFTAMSVSANETSALKTATEQASATLETEISAVVVEGEVRCSWGIPADVVPSTLQALGPGDQTLRLEGLGEFYATSAPLGGGIDGGLLLARANAPFDAEERHLLQAMAQVVGLTLRSLRALSAERGLRLASERQAAERLSLLESLQERQRLVEILLAIQRSISRRRPLPEILDAITSGAAELLDGAAVVLRLDDVGGRDHARIAAARLGDHGVSAQQLFASVATEPVQEFGAVQSFAIGVPHESGGGTVLSAAVHVIDRKAGALLAYIAGPSSKVGDHAARLAAFAQQVGLALTDAHTVQEVHLARHDALTGLPTRALFSQSLARHIGDERPTSVLFIDLVRFKSVNDTFGHLAGDELLTVVAKRLRAVLRRRDLIARVGGDEFAVLLPNTRAEDAERLGARIIDTMTAPIHLAVGNVSVGASIGAATTGPDCTDPDELVHRADMAMYQAKRRGSGSVVAFDTDATVPHFETRSATRT